MTMQQEKPLLQWKTLEFEPRNIHPTFYLIVGLLLIGIIIFSLLSNSPVMAITFILIGITGYSMLERNPQEIACFITKEGVIMHHSLYAFDTVESFWIVYEEKDKYISLKTSGKISPFVIIPLGAQDPVIARDVLIRYIPEEKHEPSIIDIIEKMIHIE